MVTRFRTKIPVILLSCVLAPGAIAAAAPPAKIGFVDIPRIERESKRVLEGIEILKEEFAPRQQALNEMNDKVAALRAEITNLAANVEPAEREEKRRELSESMQRFQQDSRRLMEDLERRKADEREKFFREVRGIAKKIAEARNLDLVLQEAVYANQAIDITNEVIRALDR